jgi:hypothetical protein
MNKTYNGNTLEELKHIFNNAATGYPVGDNVQGVIAIAEACTPQWISVEEKLPENKIKVLVRRLEYPNDTPASAIDYCIDKNWNLTMCKVTHWMPLPNPPE